MQITNLGDRRRRRATLTGLLVTVDPIVKAQENRLAPTVSTVTFKPSAQNTWHTHPLRQTLIVMSGFGRVQREDGELLHAVNLFFCEMASGFHDNIHLIAVFE